MSADAASDVVHRFDTLYEFERAPVTGDMAGTSWMNENERRRTRGGP
jgi:hypothetical protein